MEARIKTLIPMIRNILPGLIAQDITGVQHISMTGVTYAGMNLYWKKMFDKPYNRKYWPYQFDVGRRNQLAAERWCWDNFKGKYWHSSDRLFVFKRSEDAMMFSIRWGCVRND